MTAGGQRHHWRVAAASVAGSGHAKSGLPCQDAYRWHLLPGGILVAAVADGAGSAPLAEVGARTAADAASALLIEGAADGGETGERLLRGALSAARAAVGAEAAARGVRTPDLATTLTVLVATQDGVCAGQIGDGAVVTGDGTGNLAMLAAPLRGEYVNETVFLTSPEALDTAQIAVWWGAATHLAVFTDGLYPLAIRAADGVPHGPFFEPLFRWAAGDRDEAQGREQLESFLRAPRVAARTDDDLTLLLATRSAG